MGHLPSLPDNASPPHIFRAYPAIYGPWSEMSEALMNGPSPLSRAEREIILSYAAGCMGCDFVHLSHAEVAYAHGVERGLLERLMQDPASAGLSSAFTALLALVHTLAKNPKADLAPLVVRLRDEGVPEAAQHHAIAITARASFMQMLIAGAGLSPMTPELARSHAPKRVAHGYVNIYRAFRKG